MQRTSPGIVAISQVVVAASVDFPRPERLVDGNPKRTTWEHFINASGEMSCGIWACEKGAWRIRFEGNKDEFFCVIEGRVRLLDESGAAVEVGPGEAAVIPAGFCGVFEVMVPVRKYFVVVERKSPL
ncbi:hypothetical protein SAMN05660284_01212 [Formivibrio citricus]|uniref:(S)-ureidoglycine aminohydrolase cupin domain-containing protein n=1 Tax=Formivibrio citricus TaxID=83765 RepID=A0A1I4Y5Y3_9NEIS|nr:cupin domain-containing protein [Formivibrio citricus]SFN32930.1 hypothetical protein SAMN05660284_01212 [Formivibrio citricus]